MRLVRHQRRNGRSQDMLIEHLGKRPVIDPTARIAPTAVICGDVTVAPATSVGFGAVLTAEGGPIVVGRECVIMENAVIRGTKRHPAIIGDHVLVGPGAYLSGCAIRDCAFLATGSRVFNGAIIGARAEVRINATVHLLTKPSSGRHGADRLGGGRRPGTDPAA
jgi:carbonic anhydrase/acetyltransferase-like protein (isoleucine patch superfamily)